jgi:hypothetical protein
VRNTILAGLTAVGLGLALAAPARAQWIYGPGYPAYPYPVDIYGNPVGAPYGTRVYGPGGSYSHPYMYQSNNPSYGRGYYSPGYYQGYYGPGYVTRYWSYRQF